MGLGELIVQAVFWAALGIGWFADELSTRAALIFMILWATGYTMAAYAPQGGFLFMSFLAVLDLVLVAMVFKENIRLG
jgi:hypothetical protein